MKPRMSWEGIKCAVPLSIIMWVAMMTLAYHIM